LKSNNDKSAKTLVIYVSRFDSVSDIRGRLHDFEMQCIIDWWGDPFRNVLDQSIEKDVFEPYQNGEHYHSLIRFGTYISIVILKMLFQKCPAKIKPTPKRVSVGWLLDLEPLIRESRTALKKLLDKFRECFKGQIPDQLIEDLHVIRELRNAYAHRLTPVQDIFRSEHEVILEAMRNTWQDLRNEYVKVVPNI